MTLGSRVTSVRLGAGSRKVFHPLGYIHCFPDASVRLQVSEKFPRMLDEERFVVLERTRVEAPLPVTSLFGVECNVTREDNRDSSVATTGINLTGKANQSCVKGCTRPIRDVQGPFGIVWIGMMPSLLQYESSFGPVHILPQ